MSKFNKIEEEFIARGVVAMQPSNKWFVMNKTNSLAFVEACKTGFIIILGIDGFYLSNTGIQPSLANTIDFSIKGYVGSGDIYQDALHFLQKSDDNLHFEVVCK